MARYSDRSVSLWDLPIFTMERGAFDMAHPTKADSPLTPDEYYEFATWWDTQDAYKEWDLPENDEGLLGVPEFQFYVNKALPEIFGLTEIVLPQAGMNPQTYWQNYNSYVDMYTRGNEGLRSDLKEGQVNPLTPEDATLRKFNALRMIQKAGNVLEQSLAAGADKATAYKVWSDAMMAAPNYDSYLQAAVQQWGVPVGKSGKARMYGPGQGVWVTNSVGENEQYYYTEDPIAQRFYSGIEEPEGGMTAYQGWESNPNAQGSPAWARVQDWLKSQQPEGMSPYQKEQTAIDWAKFGLSREQLEESRASRASDEQYRRENLAYQRAKDEADRALSQQQYAANLAANPRNWIESWFYNNPRAGQTIPDPASEAVSRRVESTWYNWLAAKDRLATANQEYEAGVPSFNAWPEGQPVNTVNPQRWNLGLAAQDAWEAEAEYKTAMNARNDYVNQFGYGTVTRLPAAPPSPTWLPEFAPGQVAGQEMTKEAVRTPSTQSWARLDPTQRAMLAGYGGWATEGSAEQFEQDLEKRIMGKVPVRTENPRWRAARWMA